jgi:hypothetical protein
VAKTDAKCANQSSLNEPIELHCMITLLLPLPQLQLRSSLRNLSLPQPPASAALHLPGTCSSAHQHWLQPLQAELVPGYNRCDQTRARLRKVKQRQGLQNGRNAGCATTAAVSGVLGVSSLL